MWIKFNSAKVPEVYRKVEAQRLRRLADILEGKRPFSGCCGIGGSRITVADADELRKVADTMFSDALESFLL